MTVCADIKFVTYEKSILLKIVFESSFVAAAAACKHLSSQSSSVSVLLLVNNQFISSGLEVGSILYYGGSLIFKTT
jgi:hypothetical protein